MIVLLLAGCSVDEDGKTVEEPTLPQATSEKEIEESEWISVEQNLDELKELQKQVDEGHRPGLMDPIQVSTQFAYDYLDHIFDDNGKTYQVIEKDDRKQRMKIVTYRFKNDCNLEIRLNRPVGSVWAVNSYRVSGDCIVK